MKVDIYTATARILHTDRSTARIWLMSWVWGAGDQQLDHILQEQAGHLIEKGSVS